MALLMGLFGYLTVVLQGLTILAQSVMLGGVLFLALLARPLAARLDVPQGAAGTRILRGGRRIAGIAALGLAACEGLALAMQATVLATSLDMPVPEVLGAQFAIVGLVTIGCALALGWLLLARQPRPPARSHPTWLLLALAATELVAASLSTHAAARLDHRAALLAVEALHQFGAALWIGGLPYFVLALARVRDGLGWRLVGARFSRMSMAGVGCILLSGAAMAWAYVGSWQGFYGTAYGVMVGAKVALLLMLLLLGAMNFRVVERLRARPDTPVLRLRRFAEAEIGIGFSVFFAAASLTSVPPAVDLTQDRVTWQEIAARNMPEWPRLASPDHDVLAIPALQAKLDAAPAATGPAPAFVPGSEELPPRNAADIAWSEYNHHWSGLFVGLIGLLALLNRAGLRWARHWPLLFLGMAGFLALRADPEVWPMGRIGLLESLRDVEVLQHRVFVLLIVAFALFEWRVRAGGGQAGRGPGGRAALVFPLVSALGGVLLLTHSHAIANVRDQMLIELTHTPLAVLGIAAGWSRWLELRLDSRAGRVAGWVWPVCFVLIGLLLLNYREA